MTFRLEGPRFYGFDPADGSPLAGGKVYFYEKGTTTPKTTWSDQDKASPNANPVILNAAGEAAIYLDGNYKVRLDDASDVTVWTQDGISSALDAAAVQTLIDATLATVLPTYDTQAALASATVANTIERVTVLGYSDVHDAGGAEFIRVSAAPTHLLRVRSTDRFLPGGATDSGNGGWWEIAGEGYSPLVAGAVGDAVTDDTVAIDAVNDAAAPSKHVDLVGRTYEYVGTFTADAAISFTNGKIVDDATTHDFFAIKDVTGSGMITVTEPSPGVFDVNLPQADVDARVAAASVFGAALLHVRDEKTSGTGGGTFNNGAWQTRTLNTILTNEITGASLTTNVITLPTGEYWIAARAPGDRVRGHKIKLRNTSDSVDELIGTSEESESVDFVSTTSFLQGRFTVASGPKNYELQHRCNTTGAFGIANTHGVVEVYAEVGIWKVG